MTEIINCKKCGNMFKHLKGSPPICGDCISSEEDEFRMVKEYLYDNPGSSLTEVANALDISTRKLTRYLREGRIEISGDNNMLLACQSCGKSIKTGRLCNECEQGLLSEVKSTGANMKSDTVNSGKGSKDDKKIKRGLKYLNKK